MGVKFWGFGIFSEIPSIAPASTTLAFNLLCFTVSQQQWTMGDVPFERQDWEALYWGTVSAVSFPIGAIIGAANNPGMMC